MLFPPDFFRMGSLLYFAGIFCNLHSSMIDYFRLFPKVRGKARRTVSARAISFKSPREEVSV